MSKYQQNKARIREEAIEWQIEFSQKDHSWGEIAEITAYFESMGKKYGLLGEFRLNGIC